MFCACIRSNNNAICNEMSDKIVTLLIVLCSLHFLLMNCANADDEVFCQNRAEWSVHRLLAKTGFHRSLITIVQFQGEIKSGSKILIEETLPDGIYLDPFDTELKQSKEFKVHLTHPVDVEKPAYLSDEMTVFIYANLSKHVIIDIPIHVRYQKPKSFEDMGEYIEMEIANPKLYTEISEMHSSAACKAKAKMKPCINQATTCSWTEIKYNHVEPSKKIQVPHGNSDAQLYITAVTFLFTSLGCLYIVVAVVSYEKVKKQ